MKNKLFLGIISVLALLAAMVVPVKADNQGYSTSSTVLTTSTATVAANTTATVTSQSFSPNQASGFSVVPNFVLSGTANNTGNVTFNFAASLDGTNWTTITPLSYTVAATGTTPVLGYYSFPPNITGSGANNIPYWRLQSITNASTGGILTINGITVIKSN